MNNDIDTKLKDVYLFNLICASQAFKKYAYKALLDHGLNVTSDQWIVLKYISEKEGINQRDIARAVFKDPASVTRILDVLTKKRLIKRIPGADRRAFEVHLTSQGSALIAKALPLAVNIRKEGLAGLTDQEATIFKKALNIVLQNFNKV